MTTQHKPQRVRSPSYPCVSLPVALDKVGTMYAFTHKTPVMVSTMLPQWGFESGKSAGGMKVVAALKSFGLISDSGQKEQRKIVITDTAFRIINLEDGSMDWSELIKECALKPDIYNYMWGYYGVELPHFEAIKSHLVVDKKFNASAVRGFLDDYKKTIEYAELTKNDTVDSENEGLPPGIDVEEGDFVQWESDGVLQFKQPKKVRALQEHEGERWLFVEGSKVGIPMNQVTVEQKGGAKGMPPILEEEEAEEEIMKTLTGEREWMRGPLSKDIGYRIMVSGDLGPKEIGKMIRLLEAQRDILSDDD